METEAHGMMEAQNPATQRVNLVSSAWLNRTFEGYNLSLIYYIIYIYM